jgi:hypothetical protein
MKRSLTKAEVQSSMAKQQERERERKRQSEREREGGGAASGLRLSRAFPYRSCARFSLA